MADTLTLTPSQREWLREQNNRRDDNPAIEDQIKSEIKHEQKFEYLVEMSEKPLMTVNSVFPFALFPDTVSVDVSKLNIVHRELFSKRVQSIYIRNISDVVVKTGIFFASMGIIDFGFVGNSIEVNFLKNQEALEFRKVVQGLIVCVKENIDLTQFESKSFITKIKKLGEAKGDD